MVPRGATEGDRPTGIPLGARAREALLCAMPPKKPGAGDKNLKSKSPAEFFLDNKGIAGFENAGKSLYTTLREFIENSLDSAESIGVLPDVDIAVEEVTLGEYED